MAKIDIIIPQMGEGVIEATIIRWLKKEGETVAEDETIVEIATDKVDTEITSPANGILSEISAQEGDIVSVGKTIACILTDSKNSSTPPDISTEKKITNPVAEIVPEEAKLKVIVENDKTALSQKFISPLVRSIAEKEQISFSEINKINGTGKDGRVTKSDLINYIQSGRKLVEKPIYDAPKTGDTVVEMDRMRRLIADHMVMSKQVSPHVTSFAEADVTNIVKWRENNKKVYETKENQKLTFTPIFIEAIAKVLKEFPQINASVNDYRITYKKNINIGMAVALPTGNLIVPVLKNADSKSLTGLIKEVNDISSRARSNKLIPEEIQSATFTLTNLGSFGSLAGTPIINQPQVAILAVGAIKKRPVVIETEYGDTIGIRHIMITSLAYDHRVVDGALGGKFLNRFVELLEKFDINQSV